MPIPPIPEFERFLSSISIDAHAAQEGRQFFEVIPAKDGNLHSGTPAMSGSYLPGEMTFEAALKRLGEEVRKSNHLANDSMLRLLLGMTAASRPVETSAVAHFNASTTHWTRSATVTARAFSSGASKADGQPARKSEISASARWTSKE